ncbi:hypothetical protein KC717_00705 [Candidatus Dojkabacteria bacterium]|uniref:Uncharacterized protein n=1 Tax=Candidatus Dojkabacteria bacterium TaxID=2099670 RepID=A0A955L730_9BACT|nr:hypothetical protein [Candidatus Dojkabacteria bacterium]
MVQIIKKHWYMPVFTLVYIILGLIFTWPLVTEFSTKVPNNMFIEAEHTYVWGDHIQVYAGFREHKNMIANLAKNKPSLQKEFCYGEVDSECTLTTLESISKIVFSPYWLHTMFNVFFDDNYVYNLVILASFPLTGIAGLFFVQQIIKKHAQSLSRNFQLVISFIASLFVVLAPIRIHHILVGHRNGWLLAGFLLQLFVVEKIIDTKKYNWAWQVVCVLLIVYFAYTERFYMLYGLIYSAARVGWYVVSHKNNYKKAVDFFIEGLKKSIWVGVAGIAAYIINNGGILNSIGNSDISNGRPLDLITFYSPKLWYIFQRVTLEHEHVIYFGVGPIILLMCGILVIKFLRNWKETNKNFVYELVFFLGMSVLFLLISFGTSTPVYEFFYTYVPTFDLSRTPIRAMFLVIPLVSVLTGLLCAYVVQKIQEKEGSVVLQGGILAVMAIAISWSLYSFEPISLIGLPQAYEVQEGEKIVFVPVTEPGHFFGSLYEFSLSTGNATSVNGYNPFITKEMEEFYKTFGNDLNKRAQQGEDIENTFLFKRLEQEYGVTDVILMHEYISDPHLTY